MNSHVSIAVVIITYRRPQYVRENLEHLVRQTAPARQVLVVDGSPEADTRDVVSAYPWATYIRNSAGAGNMTSSRNAALAHVDADVIAFLDDDAYARPDYLASLGAFCSQHREVAIGCCRALNAVPNEEQHGRDAIGRMTEKGLMTGNFAADPGRDLEIDHGLGATMWIRTDLMRQLDGFREYFAGTSAREDTDLFLRARRLGHRAWFVHSAVAEHVAAPQEDGQRFDRRYTYWTAHNHAILLMADMGCLSLRFFGCLVAYLREQLGYGGRYHRRLARTAIVFFAWCRGVVAGLRIFGTGPVNPVGRYVRAIPGRVG